MGISDLIFDIFRDSFVKYWNLWIIILLMPIFFIALGLLVKFLKVKINRALRLEKNKTFINNNKYSSTKNKGSIGESKVSFLLEELNPEKYKVINNLKIKIDMETAQIDHLVISNFGIFVIETKNYSGIIYGGESTNYWTQKFPNNHKEKFLNSIKQDNWHISVLKNKLIEYGDVTFIPIIVFLEGADLMVSTLTDVIYTFDLIKTINKYRTEVMSDDVKESIYNLLSYLSYKS